MRVSLLIISTILSLLFLVFAIKAKKYDEYIEGLEGSDYPFKEIYPIGFVMQDFGVFKLKGSVYNKFLLQAKLLYEPQYAEYYAKLTWAQVLSFSFLVLTAGFSIAALFNSIFLAIAGVIVAGVFGYYFMFLLKNKLDDRQSAAIEELPEIVSSMALLMNAGMVLNDAIERVAYSNDGKIYNLLKKVCENVTSGGVPLPEALYEFASESNSPEVRKFTTSLVQGLDKGNKDLCDFLTAQSVEMLSLKKQHMLQKGEEAASKLLAPIGIIFVAVIIMIMAGAIGLFFNT